MTYHKIEHAMDGKVDDILTRLEANIQIIENYENEKTRIVFRAKREGNKIVVSGTMYFLNDA